MQARDYWCNGRLRLIATPHIIAGLLTTVQLGTRVYSVPQSVAPNVPGPKCVTRIVRQREWGTGAWRGVGTSAQPNWTLPAGLLALVVLGQLSVARGAEG
ncbi:hypothetical protein E2C01_037988 [Portunus trituberculatus]|uniref:Uncharacterized protein n=1 Tax=Portunus trituberculatus TaxID=210409 RepID=A0A5B7FG24_PORTR|nr:hypothetical protein [Portunus trituberculatus]